MNIKKWFYKDELQMNSGDWMQKRVSVMRDSTVFILAILTAIILVSGLILISGK